MNGTFVSSIMKSATLLFLVGSASIGVLPAQAQSDSAQITILYDAFGKPSTMKKDWGFSALIEYGGKRILFDTGNNAEIFAHNAGEAGVDLTDLDFVVLSHRHGDHTSGLNYLLTINPNVPVYAPREIGGPFGSSVPVTFIKQDESLPSEMRYFGGSPPQTLELGAAWPQAQFNWVKETTEVAPGFHLIPLKGQWGVDLELMELSLAIDTPDGTVLVVGCSHPTIEKIVETAASTIDKPIHLVLGGTHLLPAGPAELDRIATALRDHWKISWMAPVHCTGEPAFAALMQSFGDRYVYAGLGTTLELGPEVTTKTAQADTGPPQTMLAMSADDFESYRRVLAQTAAQQVSGACPWYEWPCGRPALTGTAFN